MKQLCVIGDPIEHSLSPQIHAQFAQQFDLQIEYTKQQVTPDQLDGFLADFFQGGGLGLNVTVPHKQAVREWCGTLTERAQAAGAVNTLYLDHHQIIGDNTDGAGLVDDLNRLGVTLQDASVLMLGAGGAARGALLPLIEAGARVSIHNRTQSRAQELIDDLQAGRICQEGEGPFDLVISASSAGLSAGGMSLSPDWFSRETFAYDMIYAQTDTPFIQAAKACGARHCADGLGMLVGQAARAFQRWFGELPATQAVYSSLRSR